MNIDALTKQFKTEEELRIFCAAQFNQIIQLTKKNKELEEKLSESSKKNKQNDNQILIAQSNSLILTPGMKLLDDAKLISQVQLKALKDAAFDRELTLEEVKKLDIFNRILNQQEEKKEPLKAGAKSLNEKDLLSLVEG